LSYSPESDSDSIHLRDLIWNELIDEYPHLLYEIGLAEASELAEPTTLNAALVDLPRRCREDSSPQAFPYLLPKTDKATQGARVNRSLWSVVHSLASNVAPKRISPRLLCFYVTAFALSTAGAAWFAYQFFRALHGGTRHLTSLEAGIGTLGMLVVSMEMILGFLADSANE